MRNRRPPDIWTLVLLLAIAVVGMLLIWPLAGVFLRGPVPWADSGERDR